MFSAWSLYVLLAAGALTMLLASHALAAGPLAASQPGFTILDPLTAGLLGVFLFGEHIRTDAASLAGEALALAVVIAGAAALSHSSRSPMRTRIWRTPVPPPPRPGPDRTGRPGDLKTLIPNGLWHDRHARWRQGAARPQPASGPNCMVAAFMQLLHHERGIHVV